MLMTHPDRERVERLLRPFGVILIALSLVGIVAGVALGIRHGSLEEALLYAGLAVPLAIAMHRLLRGTKRPTDL